MPSIYIPLSLYQAVDITSSMQSSLSLQNCSLEKKVMSGRADGLDCEMKENMNEQITKKAKHKAKG